MYPEPRDEDFIFECDVTMCEHELNLADIDGTAPVSSGVEYYTEEIDGWEVVVHGFHEVPALRVSKVLCPRHNSFQ